MDLPQRFETLLHGGIGGRRRVGLERCGESDGFDFAEGDGASALLLGFRGEDVGSLDDEAGFGCFGWWRGAVRDTAEDAGGSDGGRGFGEERWRGRGHEDGEEQAGGGFHEEG